MKNKRLKAREEVAEENDLRLPRIAQIRPINQPVVVVVVVATLVRRDRKLPEPEKKDHREEVVKIAVVAVVEAAEEALAVDKDVIKMEMMMTKTKTKSESVVPANLALKMRTLGSTSSITTNTASNSTRALKSLLKLRYQQCPQRKNALKLQRKLI